MYQYLIPVTKNIPFCVYAGCVYSFICWWPVGLFSPLALWVLLLWTFIYKYFLEVPVFSFLGYMPKMELLHHMEILFLIFWGIIKLFIIVVALFYLTARKVWRFWFLHILTNSSCFPFASLLFQYFCVKYNYWFYRNHCFKKRIYLFILLVCFFPQNWIPYSSSFTPYKRIVSGFIKA